MRVVILGGGYAGLTVTRRLERSLPSSVELVLVDESGTHVLQHELHRLVRYPDLEETITMDLEDLVSRANTRTARVTDLDTQTREVTITPADGTGEETLSYDVAAVCLGAETDFYGLDSVAEHALPLKRPEHARRIRDRALEIESGSVVVGGAGFSGIQIAGELAALAAEQGLELDVTLVEAADRIAPMFDATFATALERELERQDVTVETGTAVEAATESQVTLEDERTLPADLFVWTGGIRGPAALGGERPGADSDLRIADRTFVVGDAGDVIDRAGAAVPASAQAAVRQARIAAQNITKVVSDTPDDTPVFEEYRFDDPGWVVSVGDEAMAHVGPFVFGGEPAKVAKATIGAGHLSSVGEIGRASTLVAQELGWPTPDSLDFSGTVDVPSLESTDVEACSGDILSLPTDPATPSEFQYPLVRLALSLTELYPAEETLDLTPMTRTPGATAPDRLVRTVQDQLFDVAEATFSLWLPNAGTADEEPESVEIDVAEPARDERDDGNEGQ